MKRPTEALDCSSASIGLLPAAVRGARSLGHSEPRGRVEAVGRASALAVPAVPSADLSGPGPFTPPAAVHRCA